MTNEQIAALKAAAEKATPGPWWAGHCAPADGHALAWIGQWFVDSEHREPTFGRKVYNDQRADAEYIAKANPQAILSLIERLEAAEKDAERYRQLRDYMMSDVTSKDGLIVEASVCGDEGKFDAVIDSAMGVRP